MAAVFRHRIISPTLIVVWCLLIIVDRSTVTLARNTGSRKHKNRNQYLQHAKGAKRIRNRQRHQHQHQPQPQQIIRELQKYEEYEGDIENVELNNQHFAGKRRKIQTVGKKKKHYQWYTDEATYEPIADEIEVVEDEGIATTATTEEETKTSKSTNAPTEEPTVYITETFAEEAQTAPPTYEPTYEPTEAITTAEPTEGSTTEEPTEEVTTETEESTYPPTEEEDEDDQGVDEDDQGEDEDDQGVEDTTTVTEPEPIVLEEQSSTPPPTAEPTPPPTAEPTPPPTSEGEQRQSSTSPKSVSTTTLPPVQPQNALTPGSTYAPERPEPQSNTSGQGPPTPETTPNDRATYDVELEDFCVVVTGQITDSGLAMSLYLLGQMRQTFLSLYEINLDRSITNSGNEYIICYQSGDASFYGTQPITQNDVHDVQNSALSDIDALQQFVDDHPNINGVTVVDIVQSDEDQGQAINALLQGQRTNGAIPLIGSGTGPVIGGSRATDGATAPGDGEQQKKRGVLNETWKLVLVVVAPVLGVIWICYLYTLQGPGAPVPNE